MVEMNRIISPHAFRASTAVTAIVACWFALTFAVTVGGLFPGV